MKFSEIISPAHVLLDLKATDRWMAIEELVSHLVSIKAILPEKKEAVIRAIKLREKQMSTGIGFGVAIPHAATDALDKVTGVFGRSVKGIQFDALDNQPVKLVVLFLVPNGQYQQHLKTLASISRSMNDREFRDQAEQAKTADEIFQLILKQDR